MIIEITGGEEKIEAIETLLKPFGIKEMVRTGIIAMARGARTRLGADVAVAVTGIAGPDGGSGEKPVGLVYLHAEGPDGGLGREFSFPGDRASIRARATVGALHLVRTLLTRSSDEVV